MHALRDQAVRVTLAMPLTVAARLAGVSRPTLTLYEADPMAVRSDAKRKACARLYEELRRLLARAPFTREHEESAAA
jgi:hypothetical protein